MRQKKPLITSIGATRIRDCELFSTYGAAELFHCSAATVRRWIKLGMLKASRPDFAGGRYKITGKAIRQFIESMETSQ